MQTMVCKILIPVKLGENRDFIFIFYPRWEEGAVCGQPLLDTGESEQETN